MFESEDMPEIEAVTVAEPGEPRYLPWLSLFVLWVLVQVVVLAAGASLVLEGGLIGTDGYMRLVRVELLQETGAWFDGRIPRSNAPYGNTLHWTRPFDVLLLGAAWLLTPFLGFEKALFWGGSLVSPVLLLVSALAMMWASRPVIDAQIQPYVTFVFFSQMAVLSYALPGRVDHHTLQILLLVLSMGMVIRLCMERPKRLLAVLTGGVLGIGLWVSVEFLLVTLLAMTAMWLSWLRFGAGRGWVAASLAVGLAGSVALALLIERPIGAIMAEEHDRISIVHLTIMLAHLSFWALVLLGERLAGIALSPRGRLAFSLLGAVAGGAVIYVAYPKFFGGPMVDVDPEDFRVYWSKNKELQPFMPTNARAFGQLLFWVGPAMICLPYVLALVWLKRRDDAWIGWVYFAIALGLYLTLSLRHVRFAPFAEAMAVVPLAHLIGAARGRLSWIASQTWRDAARGLVSLVLIIGISGAGLVLGFRPSLGTGASAFGAAGAGAGECDIAAIAAFLNRPEPFGDRPRIIATHVDFGPELLYRTEHAVVGTPYHRNGRGIRDIYRIFSASDSAESKRLLDARGIELVLLCPSPSEEVFYDLTSERSTFYSRLRNAQAPDWMRPIRLPADIGGFRLYEVVR
jgi:hypothetical protein